MKIFTHIISVLIISLGSLSCEHKEPVTTDFEYVITGSVNNGEGVKIALIPEGTSTEDRLVAVVKDGVFEFSGTSDRIKAATLRVEDDIVQMKGSYATSMILLEPGRVKVNFDIEGGEGNYRLTMPTYDEGDKNKELLSFFREFKSAVDGSTWVFGDSIKNDSMVKHVYPQPRKNVLDLLDAQFKSGTPEISSFLLSEIVMKKVHRNGMFYKENMSIANVKRISELFHNVDSLSVSSEGYELMNDAIFQLNENGAFRPFADFTASDSEYVDQQVSGLLKESEYTLLYFWFTECRPCRMFNLNLKEHYPLLQTKGIEVIGVNVDDSRKKWMKSSSQDDIGWKNLYVGGGSGVETKYGIRGYPFKLIFKKNREPVEVEIKSVEEVLSWANNI